MKFKASVGRLPEKSFLFKTSGLERSESEKLAHGLGRKAFLLI